MWVIHHENRRKIIKNHEFFFGKKNLGRVRLPPPQDQTICLFEGFLDGPDRAHSRREEENQ